MFGIGNVPAVAGHGLLHRTYKIGIAKIPAHFRADFAQRKRHRLGQCFGVVGAFGDALQQGKKAFAFVQFAQAVFGDCLGGVARLAFAQQLAFQPFELVFVRRGHRKWQHVHGSQRTARRHSG